MQTTEKPNRTPRLGKALSTRNGTLAVSGIAALLAGAILLVFLAQYRNSTENDALSASVLVAKRLIERGSPGDVLAAQGMFQRASVPESKLKDGALVDPDSIKGQVAAADIYPGEQLTSADFTAGTPRVQNRLSPGDRALAIPVDAIHGITAQLRAGDRVDVFGGFNVNEAQGTQGRPVVKPLLRNVLVLSAPAGGTGQPGGSTGGNVVLRAPDAKAAELAFTADNGKIWLFLRPQVGARDSDVGMVTLETVLFGVRPIELERQVQGGGQ
jgi:Flp pilus assembly protein CpaB